MSSRRVLTPSGFDLEVEFGPDSLLARDIGDLGAWAGHAGAPPFTRGIVADGYRSAPWIVGQYAGFGSAEDTNRRVRQLLAQGQTGFSIALDLPTQMGYDSDHPLALGEVGKVGVALDTLADMERLFEGVPLGQIRRYARRPTRSDRSGSPWSWLSPSAGESIPERSGS